MKQSFGILLVIILVVGSVIAVAQPNLNNTVRAGDPPPTPAPTRTAGPPPPVKNFDGPYLNEPLNEKAALEIAHQFDSQHAIWAEPWKVNDSMGKRVTIQWHPDRNYDGTHHYGSTAENGPVWVITIKGQVRFIDLEKNEHTYGAVTYIIGQKTGHVLGIRY
jgi:hypothetical protein